MLIGKKKDRVVLPASEYTWSAEEFNQIITEMINAITAAGLTPDENDLTQFLQAIRLAAGTDYAKKDLSNATIGSVVRSYEQTNDTGDLRYDIEIVQCGINMLHIRISARKITDLSGNYTWFTLNEFSNKFGLSFDTIDSYQRSGDWIAWNNDLTHDFGSLIGIRTDGGIEIARIHSTAGAVGAFSTSTVLGGANERKGCTLNFYLKGKINI